MKKLWISFLLSVMLIIPFAAVAGTVNAASGTAKGTTSSLPVFNGLFTGTITGDRQSQAEFEISLVQEGDEVFGEMTLGQGLYFDGGFCGKGYLPADEFASSGTVLSDDPRAIEVEATYNIQGVTITGLLSGQLSADDEELTAEVKIDLPWFCGRDPIFQINAQREPNL